jgi:hypothetical protein
MTQIPRAITGAANTAHQVRSITVRVEQLENGRLRISTPTARGWAAVAATQPELARAIQGAFTEAQVAAYARWRGTRYDLDALTAHVPGDALAGKKGQRKQGTGKTNKRAPRAGEGWGYGQQRPDVHLPNEWAEQPDGRWRSPSGRMYRSDAAQVVRVRRRLEQTTAPQAKVA